MRSRLTNLVYIAKKNFIEQLFSLKLDAVVSGYDSEKVSPPRMKM